MKYLMASVTAPLQSRLSSCVRLRKDSIVWPILTRIYHFHVVHPLGRYGLSFLGG